MPVDLSVQDACLCLPCLAINERVPKPLLNKGRAHELCRLGKIGFRAGMGAIAEEACRQPDPQA